MSKNKRVLSVSFNIKNEEDVKSLKHIEGINFSGYVKELIIADIERGNQAQRIIHKSNNGGIKIVIGG